MELEDGGWSCIKMQLQEDTHPTNLQALKEEITRLWVLKMSAKHGGEYA
jgi:hypothetical protein